MASKRRIRRKSCDGKKPYKTRDDAIVGLIILKKKSFDENIRVYKCKFCKNFHLGHYNPNTHKNIYDLQ